MVRVAKTLKGDVILWQNMVVRAYKIPKGAYCELQYHTIPAGVSFQIVENHKLYSGSRTQ